MRTLAAILAIGLASGAAISGPAYADETGNSSIAMLLDGVDAVDEATLAAHIGQGLGSPASVTHSQPGQQLAVILWDEARPQSTVNTGGGQAASIAGALITIDVGN